MGKVGAEAGADAWRWTVETLPCSWAGRRLTLIHSSTLFAESGALHPSSIQLPVVARFLSSNQVDGSCAFWPKGGQATAAGVIL